ncbi:MAG: hypothetical protein ACU84J_01760 [Gammaproteobacteria bacterium]
MQLIFPLLSLLLFSSLYTLYLKLAARILRKSNVTWTHAFLFSCLMVFLIMLARVTSNISDISLPIVLSLFYSFGLQLGMGGWFFRKRLTNRQGELLGWRGGMLLTALTYGLFCLTFAVLWTVLHFAAAQG